MADEERAQDRYEEYYAEKIWAAIPEFYRSEDAEGQNPNAFRALVEVIAEQAAITRRSIDRLWEDQHPETSDDWAVPYIGDLLATRLLTERDPRARRVDVARTVHYRRRRGTPSLLEALVREISGWDTVLVEAFKRLARTQHRLDAFPAPLGRVTRTPAGGLANLRDPRASDLQPGPFDEFSHTPDVRQLRGLLGRFNIPKLNFHLFRLQAFPVVNVTPVQLQDSGPVTFTVDPSGRNIPLFSAGIPVNTGSLKSCGPPWSELPTSEAQADELDDCELRCLSTEEWEVARPIPCRALCDAAYVVSEDAINDAAAPDTIRLLIGFRFENEARLRARLEQVLETSFALAQPPWYHDLLRNSVTRDSAKRNLLPLSDGSEEDDEAATPVSIELFFDEEPEDDPNEPHTIPFDMTCGADLSSRQCHPTPADIGIVLLVDPELGRFAYPQAQVEPPDSDEPEGNPEPEVEPTVAPETPDEPPPPDGPTPPTAPAITPSSVVVNGNIYTLSFEAPQGVDGDDIILLADGDAAGDTLTMNVGENATVGAFGGFGIIVNISPGADPTTIGPNAEVGPVWANGDITLEAGTRVYGDVRTAGGAGSVTLEPGALLIPSGSPQEGVDLDLQPIPPALLNLTDEIEFGASGADVTVTSPNVVTLEPNTDYDQVIVQSGGTLRLGPGDYFIQTLDLEAGSELELDLGAADDEEDRRIQLNVEVGLEFEAHQRFLWGGPERFTLVYVGEPQLVLGVSFAGRLFAPRAQLVLNAPPTGQYQGQFFAGSVVVGDGTPVFGFAPVAEVHRYVYGFAGEVGAGPYTRALPKLETAPPPEDVILNTAVKALPSGVALTLGDSRTYRLTINNSTNDIIDSALQAQSEERPYVLLEGGEDVAAGVFPNPAAQLFPASPGVPPANQPRKFAVSGVWLGSFDSSNTDWVIERADGGLEGTFDWGEIVIRHSTLDPGGVRADELTIAPLRLFIRGRIERLIIEHSIVAPIIVDPLSDDARIETLIIRDSIVDARQSPLINGRDTAIWSPLGTVELERVTVLGDVRANVLQASDSIVMGRLIVANTQDSCFRFSATSLADAPLEEAEEDEAAKPRLPKLFRVPPIQHIEPFFFTSLRFGDPGYAQLSRAAPEALHNGAESTSEMGVFSFLSRSIKLNSVLTKVDEFKPVAALPQFILENESASVSEPSM